jgi:hypothetical protein
MSSESVGTRRPCWPPAGTPRPTSTSTSLWGQGRKLRGFWVGLAQLPRSHPFTVRRLERLYRMGLFHAHIQAAKTRL